MTMMKTLETVHSTVAEYIINFIAVVGIKYVCVVCMCVFFRQYVFFTLMFLAASNKSVIREYRSEF